MTSVNLKRVYFDYNTTISTPYLVMKIKINYCCACKGSHSLKKCRLQDCDQIIYSSVSLFAHNKSSDQIRVKKKKKRSSNCTCL